jgi:Trk K+ transport system NAD-binding subunit
VAGEHTVICGLERVGLRVARSLIQLGERVTIVANAPEPDLLAEARRAGARVVQGKTLELPRLPVVELATARCLVLTEDADLHNLHAAMAAREVNRGIRLVLRMFDGDLAERVTRLLANCHLISTSAEAAPYFAADAMGVATVPTRLVWGRHVTSDPPAEGPPVELGGGAFLQPLEPMPPPRRRRWRRLRSLRRGLQILFDRRWAVALFLFALIIGVSVVVFHSAQGLGHTGRLSWLDALDFAVNAAYGNFDVSGASWEVKLYVVFFAFSAALGLATIFALVADAVIGARILEALGVPRGPMHGHVIVLGLGSVGYRIVQHLLAAGVEVAAADSRASGRFVGLARRQGVPVLIVDGHYSDSLRSLSIQNALAVVAASPDDAVNLEAALAARELNPNARVVARIFDQELAERVQSQLGVSACHSVSALAAPIIVAAALGDGVLSTIEHGRDLWLLAEARVAPGSPAASARVEELEALGGMRVLAVRDPSGARWRPHCPDRVEAGQELLAACSREGWQRLRTHAAAG